MLRLTIVRANKRAFGGAEIYLERLCEELSKNGIEYDILHSTIPKWILSGLRAWLFDMQVCLARDSSRFFFSLDRVSCADVLRVGDGVHRHYMRIKGGFPYTPLNLAYTHIEARGFAHAKHLIAISEMVKRNIIDCYGVAPEKISVVYNGIPLHSEQEQAAHSASAKNLRAELCLGELPVILYVGSGYKRKGVHELLDVFARLQSRAWLLILGKERHLDAYKAHAKRLQIEERVRFLGARSDVWGFYALASVFVFPTHYEPFGNVILEAMHSRCAVVTTRQCGGGELLTPRWLMQSPSDYGIAREIDALLSDSALLERVQEENYARSLEFGIDKNAAQTMEIIARIAGS